MLSVTFTDKFCILPSHFIAILHQQLVHTHSNLQQILSYRFLSKTISRIITNQINTSINYVIDIDSDYPKSFNPYFIAFGHRIFPNFHRLVMNACSFIMGYNHRVVDLSPLRGIHILNMTGCSQITDLSPLVGIHTLDISHCGQITDLSPLKDIVTLFINKCPNINYSTIPCGIVNIFQ